MMQQIYFIRENFRFRLFFSRLRNSCTLCLANSATTLEKKQPRAHTAAKCLKGTSLLTSWSLAGLDNTECL
jgi:hypothetical protein